MLHTLFFSSKCRLFHNATFFDSCIIHILHTGVLKSKRKTLVHFAFYIFFSTNISSEYFKHAAHSLFFSSKCHLFHNATFFDSCTIHILHTGCAKI